MDLDCVISAWKVQNQVELFPNAKFRVDSQINSYICPYLNLNVHVPRLAIKTIGSFAVS